MELEFSGRGIDITEQQRAVARKKFEVLGGADAALALEVLRDVGEYLLAGLHRHVEQDVLGAQQVAQFHVRCGSAGPF